VLVDGTDARGIVRAIFDLLDGTRDEEAIAAALAEFAATDLYDLLGSLRSHGLLIEGSPAERARPPPLGCVIVQLAGEHPSLPAIADVLASAHIPNVIDDPQEGSAVGLAVGIFRPEDDAKIIEFVRTAGVRGIPSLACVVGTAEVMIGPLVPPRGTPCVHCALVRLGANARWAGPATASFDLTTFANQLVQEIRVVFAAGAECARLSGRILLLDGSPAPALPRRVLGIPGCPACSGPAIKVAAGDASPLAWFVDHRVGIVNRLVLEEPASPALGRPLIVTSVPADIPVGPRIGEPMPTGWGKGLTLPDAVFGALGEAVERYAASLPNPSRIHWAKIDALDGEVLSPAAFPLYAEAQYACPGFPYVRFDPGAAHPWVRAICLSTRQRVWVHAIMVYLSLSVRPANAVCQGSSNGLAAHLTWEEAALRAVLELLERDAFLAAWHACLPGRAVRLDSTLDHDLAAVVKGITRLGVSVEVVLLDSACGYPVAVCLGFGDGVGWPGVTFGMGADPSPRTAIRQAILELGQTGPYLRRLMQRRPELIPRDVDEVVEMLDHARYYFPAERARAFDHLRTTSDPLDFGDLPSGSARSLDACSEDLNTAQVRVALVDVTSPDISMTGFRVARAVSPDLQPLAFGFGLERQLTPRLLALGLRRGPSDVAPIW
jgi:ribosomal protein S12 methylthiotransferase accessory factor